MVASSVSGAGGGTRRGCTIASMPHDRQARLLEALRRLLRLDREVHELSADSPEYLAVQRRLDEQRKLVRRLASEEDADDG